MYENDNGQKVITLDVPQREGKEGYIGTLFGLYLRMGGIIADAHFKETDIRLYSMTHFMISLIPGEKRRKKVREDMKKAIDEATKDITSNEDRAKIRNEICLEYIGIVHDFVDKHLGVSQENRVGFVVRPKFEMVQPE